MSSWQSLLGSKLLQGLRAFTVWGSVHEMGAVLSEVAVVQGKSTAKIQLGQPLGLAKTWVPLERWRVATHRGQNNNYFPGVRGLSSMRDCLTLNLSISRKNETHLISSFMQWGWESELFRLPIKVKQHKSTYLSIVSFDHNILKCSDTETQGLFVLNISYPSDKPLTLPLPDAD